MKVLLVLFFSCFSPFILAKEDKKPLKSISYENRQIEQSASQATQDSDTEEDDDGEDADDEIDEDAVTPSEA